MPDLSKAVSGSLGPMHKPDKLGAAGVAEDGRLEPVQCSTVIIAFFGLRWECREASSRVGGNGHRSSGIVPFRFGGRHSGGCAGHRGASVSFVLASSISISGSCDPVQVKRYRALLRTLPTSAGRKQARQMPPLRRTLG